MTTEKIVILPQDVSVPTANSTEESIVPPNTTRSAWSWHVLVPFWNVIYCWQSFRRANGTNRERAVIPLFVAVAYSVVVGFSCAIYAATPTTPWLERLNAAAAHGVVQVRAGNQLGTGFVIASKNGVHLVLTNRHVITDSESWTAFFQGPKTAGECSLMLRSGETVNAVLVGLPKDTNVDLALFAAKSDGLAPLGRIQNFDHIHLGQRVAAIGHPEGLEFSITDGIVSAKRHEMFIQTNTAVNHGNSGGPLLDDAGRVIGVNTFKHTGSEGLAFATRADYVKRLADWELATGFTALFNAIQ